MPCLYSLKTMYRRLPFIILLSILAVFALRASVVAPSILVQNYSVDDYKASCQNWDLAVSYHGMLYVWARTDEASCRRIRAARWV